jgi:hypothetical protein
MKNYILFISILFLGNLSVAGNPDDSEKIKDNTTLISGKVIDKISGEEIAGAKIILDDKIVYSDLSGNFSTNIVKKTEVSITSISYNETKVNIEPFTYSSIVIELESK